MLMRPPSGKKVLWQELLRHELLDALRQRPVVIVRLVPSNNMALTVRRTLTSVSRITWRFGRRTPSPTSRLLLLHP